MTLLKTHRLIFVTLLVCEYNVFSNEENDTQNDTQNLSSLQKDILRLISTNNQITGTELAKKLGKSLTTIRRAIRGISFLKYEGPSKGGHWIIDE